MGRTEKSEDIDFSDSQLSLLERRRESSSGSLDALMSLNSPSVSLVSETNFQDDLIDENRMSEYQCRDLRRNEDCKTCAADGHQWIIHSTPADDIPVAGKTEQNTLPACPSTSAPSSCLLHVRPSRASSKSDDVSDRCCQDQSDDDLARPAPLRCRPASICCPADPDLSMLVLQATYSVKADSKPPSTHIRKHIFERSSTSGSLKLKLALQQGGNGSPAASLRGSSGSLCEAGQDSLASSEGFRPFDCISPALEESPKTVKTGGQPDLKQFILSFHRQRSAMDILQPGDASKGKPEPIRPPLASRQSLEPLDPRNEHDDNTAHSGAKWFFQNSFLRRLTSRGSV